MNRSQFTLIINGKRWTVKLKAPNTTTNGVRDLGLCDYDLRLIHVTPGPQQDTILRHEILHARFPDFSEDAILSVEQALYDAEQGLRQIGCP